MARGAGGRIGHPHNRRPIDLTGTLSVAEKNDLLTLINAITEKLHKDISNIFDSPPVTPVNDKNGHHHWLVSPLLTCTKENIQPSSHMIQGDSDGSKSFKKTHEIIEKEEQKSTTPQLKELKKEALAFFCKWQGLVLQRIRDISVNDPQVFQTGPRGRGRGYRGRGEFRGRGGRGGRAGRGGLTLATGPPRVPSQAQHTDDSLAKRYPPIPNTLWTLSQDRRKLFLHIVMLATISLQEYTANSHLLLLNLTSSLNIPLRFFHEEEERLCRGLAKAALDISPEELLTQKAEEAKGARKWKAHLGNTGTLAPGLMEAGIGTPSGSYGLSPCAVAGLLGPMADNGRVLSNLFGMNPAKPISQMMKTFYRDIQDFGLLPIHGEDTSEYCDARQRPAHDRRLRWVIAMGGWASEEEDIVKPWSCLGRQAESYVVRWDMPALLNLGSALETVIKSTAWERARKEIDSRTIFTSLIQSSWPSSLLKISKIIDNPWNVGMVRAEKAGAVLAEAIMRQKVQGERPVSLIGYSLAARAIYACLMVLAERRQFGLVESVVLIGSPVPSESRVWLTLKSVVSGRLVNVYSDQDYLLGFLCRFSNIQFGIAGLQDIQGADGVENWKVDELPKGHLGYHNSTEKILRDIGFGDVREEVLKPTKPMPMRPTAGRILTPRGIN